MHLFNKICIHILIHEIYFTFFYSEFTQQDLPEDVEFIDIEEISPAEDNRERSKSSSTVSNASSGEISSSPSEDEEALVGDCKEQENPLFIHFVCTMKCSRDSHFASIQTLPQCMGMGFSIYCGCFVEISVFIFTQIMH